MVNGRVMLRLAHRVASVMSARPARCRAPIARLRRDARTRGRIWCGPWSGPPGSRCRGSSVRLGKVLLGRPLRVRLRRMGVSAVSPFHSKAANPSQTRLLMEHRATLGPFAWR